ncbi:hypothetical protein F4677DRAFT_154807 [Hypoxylon crocopeplum]|nr:hypothetical protein F4677DRAFT_154807 [Hypoxylon crocopeplum]
MDFQDESMPAEDTILGSIRPEAPSPNFESTKLSIRVLDNGDLTANRETDLENGPLLLSIGSKHAVGETDYKIEVDPEVFEPDLDGIMTPPRQSPSVSQLPLMRNRRPLKAYADTLTPSNPSTGRSFSTPTDEASHPSLRHNHHVDRHLLAGLQPVSSPISRLPAAKALDLGLSKRDETGLESKDDVRPPLLQKYFEFSWEGGRLMFASERFEVDQDLRLSSQDLRLSSQDSTTNSYVNVASSCWEPDSTFTADELSDFYDRVVSMLDDRYWRTHGPQRSSQRNENSRQGESSSQQFTGPYGRTSRSQRTQPQSRRGQTNGSGNGDDEEDSRNNELRPSIPTRRYRDPRRVDCPFYKRDPDEFPSCCGAGHENVSRLKAHIKRKHHDEVRHCKNCHRIIDPKNRGHICTKLGFKQESFVTEDTLTRIDKATDRKEHLDAQWLRIYKILFPDDKPPFPCPYIPEQALDHSEHMERFLRRVRSELLEELIEHIPVDKSIARLDLVMRYNEGTEMWISKNLHILLSSAGVCHNRHRPGAADLETFNGLEQNSQGVNALQLDDPLQFNDWHQPTITKPSSIQHPSNSDSYTYLSSGSEKKDETFIGSSSQAICTKVNNFLTDFDTSHNQFVPSFPSMSTFNNALDMNEPFITDPTQYNTLFQQSSIDTQQLTEPWWPGARLGVDDYASFFPNTEPELGNLPLDWVDQPNSFRNLDEPFPSHSFGVSPATHSLNFQFS